MKTFKYYFRKVPVLRWLDDFTDTALGETIFWTIILVAMLLVIAAKAANAL